MKEYKIPKGMYCYEALGVEEGPPFKLLTKTCPYWRMDKTKPYQESGFCTFMGMKDWETGSLLWDQVKECGVNVDED